VESHIAFARSVARRFCRTLPSHADGDAVESDAMLGLVMAARSFDSTRGVAFTTYAARRIQGAMLDGLRARQLCSRGQVPLVMLSLDHPLGGRDGQRTTLGRCWRPTKRRWAPPWNRRTTSSIC